MAPILYEKTPKTYFLSYRMGPLLFLICSALSLFASKNRKGICAGLAICLLVFGMCCFHFLLSLLVVPASRAKLGL